VVNLDAIIRDADRREFDNLSKILEKPYGGLEIATKFVELYLDHYF